ncbi:Uncharacterised protein [Yersinia massiliensis]|nr:Uncharacterised protein [Yersinia massiliensis]
MNHHVAGMGFLDHICQLDVIWRGAFDHQHMVIRANTISILRHLFHRAGLEHPVIVVIHPLTIGFLFVGFIPIGISHQLNQFQVHTHLRFQLILNAFEFIGIKALQINFIGFAGVTVLLEHFQHLGGDVFAFLFMEPRRFDFRINTDVLTGRMIQPLNKFNLFLEGMHTEVRFAHRETTRIALHFVTVFINIEAFGKFQ